MRKLIMRILILTVLIFFNIFWSVIDHSAQAAPVAPTASAITPTEKDIFEEIPMVESPGKKLQPLSQASASTYVLTSNDIQMYGGFNTYDVLRQVPGISIISGTVAQPDVAIRGLNEFLINTTPLFLNGRNLYLPMQGTFLWETITIPNDEIKQIEIVKGPVASLYGANAMNGLINIIEKAPEDINGTYFTEQSNFTDVYTVSSFMHGRKADKYGYKISAQWKDYEYFYRTDRRTNLGKFNTEVDYYLDTDTKLALSSGGAFGKHAFQSTMTQLYLADQNMAYLYTMAKLTKDAFTSSVFWNHLMSAYSPPALGVNAMLDTIENENKYTFSLFNDAHSCIAGGGVRYDRVRSGLWSNVVEAKDQFLFNLYLQDDWKIVERLRLVSSGRWDYNTLAGNNFTGRVAALLNITDDQLFRASIGNAFRAPSLTEFLMNSNSYINNAVRGHNTGNPDIKVERVVTGEVGYEGTFLKKKLKIGVDTFCSYYKNFIETFVTNPAESFAPFTIRTNFMNRGTATTMGLETSAEYRMVEWMKAFANYSYQLIGFEGGAFIRSTPRNKFNVGILMDMDNKIYMSAYVNYVGNSYNGDPDANNFKLPSYCTLNGRVAYKMTKNIMVGVSVQNAFLDKHLESYSAGEVIGRRVLAELRAEF